MDAKARISSFMKEVVPSRQKRRDLYEMSGEIAHLKENGYSIRQIQEFLCASGVPVTYEGLQKFFLRNIKGQKK